MAKKVTRYAKSKIYHPKFYSSDFSTNIITDNITNKDGSVINRSSENADYASRWVSEHQM